MFLSKQKESPFSFRELLFHLCNNQLSNISNNNKRLGSKNKIIIPELIHIIVNGKPHRGLCYMCTNGFKVEGVTYSAHSFLRTQCHCCKVFLHADCNFAFHNPKYQFFYNKSESTIN
ncbi:hypothetical protein ACTFIR_006380 [Dictyostelium discoideum]